jgi:hypothetical protein
MKSRLIVGGILLIIVGLVFTFFTFGLGIVCAWPLFVIGFLLVLLGLVLPGLVGETRSVVTSCPGCGADVPDDAAICPTCGHIPRPA